MLRTDGSDGGPAFPVVTTETNEYGMVFPYVQPGMSLRDWFAGQALAALIGKSPLFDREGEYGPAVDLDQFRADMSVSSYAYADAMIAARNG